MALPANSRRSGSIHLDSPSLFSFLFFFFPVSLPYLALFFFPFLLCFLFTSFDLVQYGIPFAIRPFCA
jgi:hypothetical protein